MVKRYCSHCGKLLEDNATFCSYCGYPVFSERNGNSPKNAGSKPQKRSQEKCNSKRKGLRKTVLWLIIIVLIAGVVCGGYLVWNIFRENDSEKEFAVYEDVNNVLVELTSSEDYNSVATEEKAQLILDELAKMEDSGMIGTGSVEYDSSTQLVSFEYADGVYGGIMLEDFGEGTSGIGTSSYTTTYADHVVSNLPSIPDFDLNSYPYEERDLRALIICDFGEAEAYSGFTELSQSFKSGWTNAYIDTDLETDGNVALYRTGLSGYDMVVIQEHGLLYKNECLIVLQETTNFVNYAAKKLNLALTTDGKDMLDDLKANRVAVILAKDDNKFHYCLLPAFFTYYYGNGLLEDSIVWLGCCDGYYNDTLVSAFADCGAVSVLATTETTSIAYNFLMQDAFMYMLLSGNTVEESLSFAKTIWGENDGAFADNYSDLQDDTPSEIRFYNGGGERLVTLTAEAEAAVTPADNETVITEKIDESESQAEDAENTVVSEETLREILTAYTDEDVLNFIYDDFDYNGIYEAIAFCGECSESEVYCGTLYFISKSGVSVICGTGYYWTAGGIFDFENTKIIYISGYVTTGSIGYYYEINGESVSELAGSGQAGTLYLDSDGRYCARDSQYDASVDGIGHTWNVYYFYWNDGLKEYGGTQISEDEFLSYVGAAAIIETINGDGYNVASIYKRENGIININACDGIQNVNVRVIYENGNVESYPIDGGYGFYESGIIYAALIPEIAVYGETVLFSETDTGNTAELVTDAYNETYGSMTFQIPQINIESDYVLQVNLEIWETLYSGVVEEILSYREEYDDYDGGEYISYEYHVNDHILSLVIESHPVDWAWWDYYVYNIDIVTGEQIPDSDIISFNSLSDEDYRELVRQALYSYNCEGLLQFYLNGNDSALTYEQLKRTISDDNISAAVPFLNENGQTCIIGRIYSVAGADYYDHIINLYDFELNANYPQLFSDDDNDSNFAMYEDVFKEYQSYMSLEDYREAWDIEWNYLNSTVYSLGNVWGSNKMFYYAFEDADNNGVSELYIGIAFSSEEIILLDVFTYDGENAVFLDETIRYLTNGMGYSQGFTVYESGIFATSFYYSAGEDKSEYAFYKISADGYTAELLESLSRENGIYYYGTDTVITEEEFNAYYESYTQQQEYDFDWIELTDMSYDENSSETEIVIVIQ